MSDASSNDELLPCPLCGEFADLEATEYQTVRVRCWGCGALGPQGFKASEAVELWNKRTVREISFEI